MSPLSSMLTSTMTTSILTSSSSSSPTLTASSPPPSSTTTHKSNVKLIVYFLISGLAITLALISCYVSSRKSKKRYRAALLTEPGLTLEDFRKRERDERRERVRVEQEENRRVLAEWKVKRIRGRIERRGGLRGFETGGGSGVGTSEVGTSGIGEGSRMEMGSGKSESKEGLVGRDGTAGKRDAEVEEMDIVDGAGGAGSGWAGPSVSVYDI